MNWKLKSALGASALLIAAQATAQITFYENEGFRGRTFTTDKEVVTFETYGFNDRASSVAVEHGAWEVCEDWRFEGRCVVLRRGSYDSLRGMGMDKRVSSVRPLEGRKYYDNEAPEPAVTNNGEHITFYENEGFRGHTFVTDRSVGNFKTYGFNDRASSVVVDRGTWEVCEDSRFGGR